MIASRMIPSAQIVVLIQVVGSLVVGMVCARSMLRVFKVLCQRGGTLSNWLFTRKIY